MSPLYAGQFSAPFLHPFLVVIERSSRRRRRRRISECDSPPPPPPPIPKKSYVTNLTTGESGRVRAETDFVAQSPFESYAEHPSSSFLLLFSIPFPPSAVPPHFPLSFRRKKGGHHQSVVYLFPRKGGGRRRFLDGDGSSKEEREC